ncbi:MAG: Nramp family divalent metal transporter [Gammaproteobacteria bacterium]
MVVAAGLVGSGELIATTKVGAQAGVTLIWLILFGCVIKVFTQIELGRYTLSSGETTLHAINRVPGPRFRANWIIWLWLIMMCGMYGMMGGILGGVGQSLAMVLPISGDYAQAIATEALMETTNDDRLWAIVVAVGTSTLLYFGRYSLLETVSIALVFCFTVVTVGNVIALQNTDYAISAASIVDGLSFGLPPDEMAWLTAIAAFGIIGMGGTDLIVYPYWCIEKGYTRFVGSRSPDEAWAQRANGWLRVMKIDAFFAMVVYTTATLAFYLIGAAVLHKDGNDPDGMRMVSVLASAYVPVFGTYAKVLFLTGALAVLYSSFLVANAGAARLLTDCLSVMKLLPDTRKQLATTLFSVCLPLLCLLIFLTGWNPVRLVVIGGLVQSVILPAIGLSALYFRYKLTDQRLHPGKVWDVLLVLSCISFVVVGGFGLWNVLT